MAIKEESDIVKDILGRVRAIMGPTFTGDISVKLESDIRNDWGGDRYYVAQGKDAILDRNMSIFEVWGKGEVTIRQLSERFQMSERQIRRILKR
jgi:Mor family transcriptional regulator